MRTLFCGLLVAILTAGCASVPKSLRGDQSLDRDAERRARRGRRRHRRARALGRQHPGGQARGGRDLRRDPEPPTRYVGAAAASPMRASGASSPAGRDSTTLRSMGRTAASPCSGRWKASPTAPSTARPTAFPRLRIEAVHLWPIVVYVPPPYYGPYWGGPFWYGPPWGPFWYGPAWGPYWYGPGPFWGW